MSDFLQTGANVMQIVEGIAAVAGIILASVGATALVFKKTRRLSKNLNRPLAIFPSDADDMSAEVRLLKGTGFFKHLEVLTPDGRSADAITDDYRIAVLRYDRLSKDFWTIYDSLRTKRIPVVIYARPDEIDRSTDHMARIQEYSYHTLCNTPTRLLSDVWAIMATYPEAK